MSYEHCERHDRDATNGCETCADEAYAMRVVEKSPLACVFCGQEPGIAVVRQDRALCSECVGVVREYLDSRGGNGRAWIPSPAPPNPREQNTTTGDR